MAIASLSMGVGSLEESPNSLEREREMAGKIQLEGNASTQQSDNLISSIENQAENPRYAG